MPCPCHEADYFWTIRYKPQCHLLNKLYLYPISLLSYINLNIFYHRWICRLLSHASIRLQNSLDMCLEPTSKQLYVIEYYLCHRIDYESWTHPHNYNFDLKISILIYLLILILNEIHPQIYNCCPIQRLYLKINCLKNLHDTQIYPNNNIHLRTELYRCRIIHSSKNRLGI